MSDLNDILHTGPGKGKQEPLSEDKLMAYLEGSLSPAEQHEVEQWMADDGMEADALEGLNTIQAGEAKQSVSRLNSKLGKTLSAKKARRRPMASNQYTLIAIAIILMLVILAFVVIKLNK